MLNDLRYAQADGAANSDWVEEYLFGGNNNAPLSGTPPRDSLAVMELAVRIKDGCGVMLTS